MWEQCFGYNGQNGCETDCIAQCNLNPDCRVQKTDVDKHFKFNVCVPKYPPGFDLSSTSGLNPLFSGTSASQVCSLASQTCIVTYVKGCPGGWKCKDNCDCMDEEFTLKMNNLCVSLGDCGAYTNIAGTVTDGGYSLSKKGDKGHVPPRLTNIAELYSVFAKAVAGQFVKADVYDDVPSILDLPPGVKDPFLEGENDINTGGSSGGGGILSPTTLIPALGVGAVAGGIAGAVGGSAVSGVLGGGGFAWGTAGMVGAIAIVAVIVLMQVLGCGKVKQIEIHFECKPWTQPNATLSNCDFCNKNPLKSCSKYRCESLGINCRVINEDSDGKCIDKRTETKIPTITPWDEILNTSLYRYENASRNGFRIRDKNGGCIQAFTPLVFGVETDVYAQCKILTERNLSGGEGMDFFEGSKFTKNHTYATYLPSADSIIASETSNIDEFNQAKNNETLYNYILNQVGDFNLYVKCVNINGQENIQDYQINFCVKPGPDLTPQVVTATAPPDKKVIAFNATEQQMILFISEPSECKWDNVKPASSNIPENYNLLTNNMNCNTDVY